MLTSTRCKWQETARTYMAETEYAHGKLTSLIRQDWKGQTQISVKDKKDNTLKSTNDDLGSGGNKRILQRTQRSRKNAHLPFI